MANQGAHSVGARGGVDHDRDHKRGMTPAQWFCLLAGLGLLLAGIFGFLADGSFDTAGSTDGESTGNANGQLQGDGFLGFEVNGWHNIVHLLSGLALLSAFRKAKLAKTMALAFGIIYAIVTLIGLIDGNDVLGILPINPADNILHLALSALGIGSALASRGHDHDRDRDRVRTTTAPATTGRRVDTADVVRDREVVTEKRTTGTTGGTAEREGRFERELDPRDLNPHDGTTTSEPRRTL